MPLPPSPRTRSGVRRRSLIVSAAAAAALAGCSTGSDSAGTAGTPSVSMRARARAARDSRALLARYDAVLAVHPALAERLRPLRAEVAAHAAAFEEGSDPATASPTSTSPTATASASASLPAAGSSASPSAAASPAVPADAQAALAVLATAERTLADQRAKALLDVPGELARLLAGVAAAGAGHAYLLTKGDK
ncbi:hypothetical protein [Streptomyces arenae]|uniref:hypothetical protein n=1 Tax=Streptomyces arenae TaxID=29301 RepID=UPI00265811A2|nr:hypothetical protein [Streptomyces arenae]MCG7204352.1 hypothetical protein [Streptomyces arenae]